MIKKGENMDYKKNILLVAIIVLFFVGTALFIQALQCFSINNCINIRSLIHAAIFYVIALYSLKYLFKGVNRSNSVKGRRFIVISSIIGMIGFWVLYVPIFIKCNGFKAEVFIVPIILSAIVLVINIFALSSIKIWRS